MNFDSPISHGEVEPLVRAALEAEGRMVDISRVQAEIAARLKSGAIDAALPAPQIVPTKFSPRRAVRFTLAAAACLLVAVGLGEYFTLSAAPASAYALVQSAHSVLSTTRDRCYRVEMNLPKDWLTKNSFLQSGDQKLVWTRGDRFRFVMSKGADELVWGQDEEHRLWVVCDKNRALLFNPDEAPPALALTLSYMSLDFSVLSLEILENFDLSTDDADAENNDGLITVLATAKPGRKSLQFQAARLEIDPKTKIVRKMELTRLAKKIMTARVTFTLLNEEPQSDASYTLEGNSPPGARIIDKERGTERSRLFRKLLL